MCWQCGSKPAEWLNIFESFQPIGWYFGPSCGDGVFEFVLEGQVFHTNPALDLVEWMAGHIPGEIDQNGDPWFLPGSFSPTPEDKFRLKF